MTGTLIKDRKEKITQRVYRGEKVMWRQRQRLEWCFYKARNAKDCPQAPEAGRGMGWIRGNCPWTSMGPASCWDSCGRNWGAWPVPSLFCVMFFWLLQGWRGGRGGRRSTIFTLCWCPLDVADIQMLIISLAKCLWNSLSNLWLPSPYTANASLFGCERPSLCPWSGNSSCRHPLGSWQLKASHLSDIQWPQEAHSSCCARL